MSGPSFKEIILAVREKVDKVVNSGTFNAVLLTASCAHMAIIAMNSCHGKQGENDPLCGKVWVNCKAAVGKDYYEPFDTESVQCLLRLCLRNGCQAVNKSFADRPLYADILYQANFSMRWVYTGVTALRMWGSGLFMRDQGFFWSGWSFLDFIIVVSAWMNDPFQFGNMMFIMVLRGVKLLMESSSTLLIVPRVQLKAIGMGVFKVFLVFVLLNFIMAFVSLLAMSLIGSKGDFHNRCAVPLKKVLPDGNVSFTYEPIVPEVACRMDHLWNANVRMCYGDVWGGIEGADNELGNFVPSRELASNNNISSMGCQGTCSRPAYLQRDHLGKELDLDVSGFDKFGNALEGSAVYCIGPDFEPIDKKSIPPKTIDGQPLEQYRPADTTNWPSFGNNDPRNFDNIGQSAIVLYTIFFRNAWTETIKPAASIGGHALVLGWILLMIFTSYYLLNITVSITCSHYSDATVAEAARMEAIAKANALPTFDDDEEGAGDPVAGDEQNLDGYDLTDNTREKLLKEMDKDGSYPWCGRGCDCFTFCGNQINKGCNAFGKSILLKYKFLVTLKVDKACLACQTQCGNIFKNCCHRLIRMSIKLNFPPPEDDDSDEDTDEKKEPSSFAFLFTGSIVSRVSVVCMIGVMISQGLQNSNIGLYKCECSDADIDQMRSFNELAMCTPEGACLDANGDVATDMTCLYDRCIKNARPGYPCFNPRYNHKVGLLSSWYEANGEPDKVIVQAAASEWADNRVQWCTYGMLLHFVLYGWAVIFLLELLVRYLGHQGFLNFFTMRLYPVEKEEAENDRIKLSVKLPMSKKAVSLQLYPFTAPDGKTEIRLNFRNIIDSLCIIATTVGIVLTEITFAPEQALLSNVDFYNPTAPGFKMGNLPWIFKLLRLATLIRLAIRISAIAQIPAVAVILRGFRGAEKVAMGVTFLILMIFFFALLGKELFDYGYSNLRMRFEALYDFSDVSSSMLPLLEIMIGSGWYSYAKAGIAALGVSGFLYFSLFFFIVNFQFLRIFIAIIVQNYELTEQEKLDAQQLILFQNFEKLEQPQRKKEKKEFVDWDKFSFNKHYMNLLRGAQVTLRKLEGYQRQLKEEGPLGFNEDNERELAGDSDDEDGNKKMAKDDDGPDKVLQQIKMIKNRLSINPQDWNQGKNEDEKEASLSDRVKEQLTKLVKGNWFNIFVMLVVIVSTVLAVYTTLDEDTGIAGLSDLISVVLLGFFIAEMSLKMMAYGLFKDNPAGYFKRGWCILDFVLVLLQVMDVIISAGVIDVGDSADIFKGFRAIRIARLLARLQNLGKDNGANNPLKVILQALGASLPGIMILLTAVIFMMFVFALVGIDQYAGLLFRCVTENPLDLTETTCVVDGDCFPGYSGQCSIDPDSGAARGICTMDKMHCYGQKQTVPAEWVKGNWKSFDDDDFSFLVPRNWQKTPLTFDDMGTALYTMFSLVNRSGIRDMLLQILSVTERDKAPIQNNNPAAGVYIIVLIIVVGVFVSQVNVGLMMTNLRLKSGLAFHTKEQLVWPATRDAFRLSMPTPFPPKKITEAEIDERQVHPFVKFLLKLQMKFQRMRDSWKFNYLMTATVMFNCALLGVLYFDMPGDLQVLYFWGGFACFVLYVLEFVIKTIADAKGYFMSPADQFDILLTLLNALDLFVWPQYNVDLGLGSLRMFRLFRLFNRVDAFVRLVETIRKSFPQAVAAVVLTFMVIFISSAIATRMFTYVKEGQELDSNFNNFSNFILSLIAMFRVSSGAGWGQVIVDAGIGAPDCTPKWWTPYYYPADETNAAATLESFGPWLNDDMYPEPRSDCGLAIGAYAFFLIFIFINNYILLPTFVASIIASYFEANLKEHSLISIPELVTFRDCWVEVGPKEKGVGVSVLQFDRNQDPKTSVKMPFIFDRFDALLSILTLNGSRLGFSKTSSPDKYKAALQRMQKRQDTSQKGSDKLEIPYKTMAVMLLSIAEKSRPVTIVDILRRNKAIAMLQEQSRKPDVPKKRAMVGKQHAAIGVPKIPEWADGVKVKQQNLKQEDFQYSYNIYVVLDQLVRMEDPQIKLGPKEYTGLKEMVTENDEDLFIYFEEYVEKSGPVYHASGDAWKALTKFGKKAKDVFATSKHNTRKEKKPDGEEDSGEEGDSEKEGDEPVDPAEGGEEEGGGEGGEVEGEDGSDSDDGILPVSVQSAGKKFNYGQILEDQHGTLDLTNWEACPQCGEPVDRNWDRCPNCGQKQHWPPKQV